MNTVKRSIIRTNHKVKVEEREKLTTKEEIRVELQVELMVKFQVILMG